jgi:plastocyanin
MLGNTCHVRVGVAGLTRAEDVVIPNCQEPALTCCRIVTLALVVVLIAPVIHFAPRAVTAQEATDELTADIYAGACGDAVGEPAASLVPPGLTEGDAVGAAEARPVANSFSTVHVSLDALLADGHVVAIVGDQETAACGAIGGLRTATGAVVIELREQGNSGLSGVAYLADSAANPGQTDVSLFLAGLDTTQPDTRAEPTAGPSTEANATAGQDAILKASNEPSSEVTTEVTVTITNPAFDPDPVIIPVGGTITWINNDGVPHTVTGDDGAVIESGVLTPLSGRYSQTFTEAGTFSYHSEFNLDMHGTVIVEPAAGLFPGATAEASQQGLGDSTAEPAEEAPTSTETYISPNFGYSLSYDPSEWSIVEGPSTDDGIDHIGVRSGFAFVSLDGTVGIADAQECVLILTDYFTSLDTVASFEPLLDATGAPVAGGNAFDAFAATNIDWLRDDGTFEETINLRCIVLPSGEAALAMLLRAPEPMYPGAERQLARLLQGLTLP